MTHLTREEIIAAQDEALADVEAQLAEGLEVINIHGRLLDREPAWAAAASLRKCRELDAVYGGQELLPDGTWNALIHVNLGTFPG